MSVYKTFKLNDFKSVFVTRNLKKQTKSKMHDGTQSKPKNNSRDNEGPRSPRELARIFITRSDRCLSDIDLSEVVIPNFEFQQKREEL